MVRGFGEVVSGGLLIAVLVAAGLAPFDAQAQPTSAIARAKTQVATAKAHAGFATGATTLADFQQHMGHVLNCVEGKGGKNFNAKWGHVCEGQGNGILADLREVPGRADLLPLVQQIGLNALGATMSSRLNDAATDVAEGVEAMLEMVEGSLK